MRRCDVADFDILRVRIAPEHLLERELSLVFLLMMCRVLLLELGGLKLRLDQVLLQTLTYAIAGFGDLLDLLKLVLIAIENLQCFRVIEQLEVDLLDLLLDFALRSLVAMPGVVGIFFCFGFLQAEFAGTRDVLRHAKAGVVEVAALITRKRLRAADREVLKREFRIR